MSGEAIEGKRRWTMRKKDDAPKGLFRHPAGLWCIRYVCGTGHAHQQQASASKTEALRVYHARRGRVRGEPGPPPRGRRAVGVGPS